MKLRPAEVVSSFHQRRDKVRVIGARQGYHSEAVRKRRQVLLQFVGRAAGRNEMDFVKVKAAVRRARDSQVAIVNRIEGSAKEGNAARVMFYGGAMRLRGRQCASGEDALGADGAGALPTRIDSLTNLFHR
jgi:hypothetical protein